MVKQKLVSIIVPAHNEEKNLPRCVSSLIKTCGGVKHEIIIVDDCSSDSTGKIADFLAKKNRNVRVVHRKMPNGFGLAIRSGLDAARGDILIPFMCDLSDDPKTILTMVDRLSDGYDIAIGSRFVSGGRLIDYPKMKYLAHRAYSTVVSVLFMKNIRDFSNAFKAYRRETLRGIKIGSTGFEITAEMILKPIALKKVRIIEIPTVWTNRKSGKAKFTGLFRQGLRYGRVMLDCLMLRVTGRSFF